MQVLFDGQTEAGPWNLKSGRWFSYRGYGWWEQELIFMDMISQKHDCGWIWQLLTFFLASALRFFVIERGIFCAFLGKPGSVDLPRGLRHAGAGRCDANSLGAKRGEEVPYAWGRLWHLEAWGEVGCITWCYLFTGETQYTYTHIYICIICMCICIIMYIHIICI